MHNTPLCLTTCLTPTGAGRDSFQQIHEAWYNRSGSCESSIVEPSATTQLTFNRFPDHDSLQSPCWIRIFFSAGTLTLHNANNLRTFNQYIYNPTESGVVLQDASSSLQGNPHFPADHLTLRVQLSSSPAMQANILHH